MKKKKKKHKHITDISLVNFVAEATKTYGSYVVQNRALVDLRDGLKPVHRRILWAMYNAGFFHNKPYKKSARTVGDTLGKFHPHGDMACYGAMVTSAMSPERLIDGQGNWGDYTDDPPADMRYTEARLTKYSQDIFLDPDYLAVIPMVYNYDGEFKEPVYLPAKLPNVLINGTEGIAMGCSSLIPSFTKESVIKVVKDALKGKNITPEYCVKNLVFNFTWGGICVSEKEELLKFFKTGFNSLHFMPYHEIKGNKIIIENLAPRLKVETMVGKLEALKDLTIVDNREGDIVQFELVIKSKCNDAQKQIIVDKVLKIIKSSLPCQTIITKRLKDGERAIFKRTDIPTIIKEWAEWRVKLERVVVIRLYKLEKKELDRQNLLSFAIDNRKIIVKALDEKEPIKFLVTKLKITEETAKYIWQLRLQSLAKISQADITNTINKIKKRMKDLGKDFKNIKGRILKQLGD